MNRLVAIVGTALCLFGCAPSPEPVVQDSATMNESEVQSKLADVPTKPRRILPEQVTEPTVFPVEILTLLRHAETVELISLDPEELKEPPPDNFHRFKMLGSTKLVDQATRDRLTAALRTAVEKKETSPAKCFWPHHGLRTIHDGQIVDLSICFSCSQIAVFVDNRYWGSMWVDSAPHAMFDKALRAANVPVWERKKKEQTAVQ